MFLRYEIVLISVFNPKSYLTLQMAIIILCNKNFDLTYKKVFSGKDSKKKCNICRAINYFYQYALISRRFYTHSKSARWIP